MSPSPTVSEVTAATRPPSPTEFDRVALLVDALGVAWTTFRLYRDPRSIEAFQRAVATLGTAPAFPWLVEVRRDDFVWSRRPVPANRSAVSRLARDAFARGIGALGFTTPPGPEDVLAIFEVIAGEPARAGIGPLQALAASGAAAVLLVEHGALAEGEPGVAAPSEGYFVVDRGAFQAGTAADGEERLGGSVEQFLDRYLWEYGRFHDGADPADLLRHGELMRACIDSLAALSREDQADLLTRLLERHEETAFRTLLDQLSDDELARLSQDLDAHAHPLLWEYLRIACDQQSRSPHLLRRLLEGEGSSGRLAGRIERLLGGALQEDSGSAAARLAAQQPDGACHFRAGVATLASLIDTPDERRFRRLLRVWSQKVTAALATGDLAAAEAWLGAIARGSINPERLPLVRREVEAILRAGLLDSFVAESPAEAGRAALVAAVAGLAMDPLIDQLGAEPDRGRRRSLVEAIATAAGTDPVPVMRRLQDPRWYLVRNLVAALGRSRRPEAAAAVAPLLAHQDHRVRAESLRALRSLDPEAAEQAALVALEDPHRGVRLQALTLLRTSPRPDVDEALARQLASGPAADEALSIVETLGRRGTEGARALLRRLAARRLALSPAQRAIRAAARRALAEGPR